jgi:ABC-type multidrug transport system ATPase subunit
MKENAAVLLTTHSMEEAEALCSRIGILVNGQLQCLGTTSHLKNKHGLTYQVDLICKAEQEKIKPSVNVRFGAESVNWLEELNGKFRFEIKKKNSLPCAEIFEFMEELQDQYAINEFSVGESTLDQVFIRFAREQE